MPISQQYLSTLVSLQTLSISTINILSSQSTDCSIRFAYQYFHPDCSILYFCEREMKRKQNNGRIPQFHKYANKVILSPVQKKWNKFCLFLLKSKSKSIILFNSRKNMFIRETPHFPVSRIPPATLNILSEHLSLSACLMKCKQIQMKVHLVVYHTVLLYVICIYLCADVIIIWKYGRENLVFELISV